MIQRSGDVGQLHGYRCRGAGQCRGLGSETHIEYRLIGDDEFAEYTDPVSVTAAAGAIVVLRANGKRVGKATVSSAKATTVKIKLKPKHTRKKNVKLRALFVPTDKSTVKALKSKVKKVKVRR